MKAYDRVKIARQITRPTALDYINHCFKGFIELHGDRAFGDDGAVVGGIAWFGDMPVTVIGIQKGKDVKECMKTNFGCANPEGYRKALRLMKQAEKFNRPVICFVNTSGAYPGMGAEERGQGEAIAKNLFELSRLKTPVISIIIGEGGSGGALALAVADRVWMLENSVYAVLSPEGFASILWKDGSRAEEAADIMKITAHDLYDLGVIERVIDEVPGGAQEDFEFTANLVKHALEEDLPKLTSQTKEELVQNRYNRFRAFGVYNE